MIYFTLPPFLAPNENIFLKCPSYPIKDFRNAEKGRFLENATGLLTERLSDWVSDIDLDS